MGCRCRFGTAGKIAAAIVVAVATVGCSSSSTTVPAMAALPVQPMIAPAVLPPGAASTSMAPQLMAPQTVAVRPVASMNATAMPAVPRAVSGQAVISRPAVANSYPAAPAPAVAAPLAMSSQNHDLKVMTFNLRVATAFDLLNTWELRKGQVVGRVRSFDPDLLGTQEGLNGMENFLKKELSDYTFFGVGRDDGKHGGEMCGVFFKTSKFDKLDGGNFWLSTNPEKPGSKAWGAWFPRMVTWVKLQPRDGGRAFVWFNTHFEVFSDHARTESAKLLLARMTTFATGLPCVVTGDFNANAGEKCAAYSTLTSKFNVTQLVDAFRAVNPLRTREEGTMHSFNGHRDGDRIDWILATPAFQPVACEIDRTRGFLGYPSDHFPVTATFHMPSTAATPAMPVARIE